MNLKKILLSALFLAFFSLHAYADAEKPLPPVPQKVKIETSSETPAAPVIPLANTAKKAKTTLDLKQVFSASPVIYSVLLLMSVSSLVIWLYSLITFRSKDIMQENFLKQVREFLYAKNYDHALGLCRKENHFLAQMVACGINTRVHGSQAMLDAMKSEGKRASSSVWQRLSLLNDIVVTAPMLGLLGTVIGMFYAFYDVNRSIESITALFDGLGIAVGTTVVGLIVSILSMIFHTTLKYRLVRTLSQVENEAFSLSALIEAK